MKKYLKYGKLRKIIHDLDLFKSPANLRMKTEPDSSQYCSGIFSMLLFGLFIFILASQFSQVVNNESIYTDQSSQLAQNLNQPLATNILFGLAPNYLGYDIWSKFFRIQANLIIQSINNKTKIKIKQIHNIKLEKCRKQQWQNLSQIYNSYKFYEILCIQNPQQISIYGTNFKDNLSYVSIILKRCIEDQTNRTCKNDRQFWNKILQLQVNQTNFYSFYIIDTLISADKEDPINKIVKLNYDFHYSSKMRQNLNLYLGQYYVETDKSLLPYKNQQIYQGYYINQKIVHTTYENISKLPIGQQILGQINIYMGNKKKIIKRTIGKIDQVISYTGGLFGIIIGVFIFIINSYNEYSYQLKVAQSSFNFDQHGKQIKQKRFNFIKYIKYGIYDWIKFMFCYQINWKYDKLEYKTMQQSNATMDVMNLYRKIQLIQLNLGYFCDRNQLILLNLTKPPTIKEVQQKRNGILYYNKIIGGRVAINIQDIIQKKQSLIVYKQSEIRRKSRASIQNLLSHFHQPRRSLEIRRLQSLDSLVNHQQQIKPNILRIKKTLSFDGNQPENIVQNTIKQEENKQKAKQQKILDFLPIYIKQQIKKKFLKYSGIKDEDIINKISNYTQIAQQAQCMQLAQEMRKIQQEFAQAYLSLKINVKKRLTNRIPLKILHRLFDCLQNKLKVPDSSIPLVREKKNVNI